MRYPWYRIVWNILWIISVCVTAGLFLGVVFCAYGKRTALEMYDAIR